jgi:hypothetical protein
VDESQVLLQMWFSEHSLCTIELDEERREINRNERKYWKNDKMVRDYAFAIPRVAASSIVTFRSHEHHACGLA